MALVVATACGSGPSTVATTSPSPAAVLDDHFGFIAGNSVRVESGARPLFVLAIPSDTAGVVSPDGRRLAYLADNQLNVINIASGAQPRTLFALGAKEGAMYLAWSSDSTGLVVGVTGPLAPVNEGLPSYTKLRVVDAAGGASRDVISIPQASVVPLAWDRQAHLISAYEATQSGAGAYDVVAESGTFQRTNAKTDLYILAASQDGKHVFGHGDPNNVVRVWPIDSYDRGVELRGTTDEHVATVAWRPGTAEVGVLFHGDRLELWDANGARRTIALPAAKASSDRLATLAFRADGKAVVISRQSGVEGSTDTYAVAVDLASGRSVLIPMVGDGPLAGTSVRISS
ncbi:MAG TPA: WD40 repeat domain-containing protein [Candidatus Dormibacteraeota bacterium]|nr:WD40 repeat domain-containing protein [Candidatus Dormibacteraeota bacterium]